ncbi:MAG: HAMP domain-containing histidine kinase [Pseudodesulfovibrio sp.]|uniref:histidine kinase n=1 Tax=Pseudodesulfovibrio aespoeensis (strain ATCC 700646 / DSM 10631 / Aspo-2) TaxID=643562 RepID=E6VZG6_PSEA9|nr:MULTISPECIES: HAMP domain-containing sensor histidine kinase [Pseudodesulfovibrio]MBU4192589.1 HAMP domain-containing histidine kinase [Pseudomonadota bacterium]ADU61680.1 ATP-binding region ATPase domain protein [Pseudodesulfovibrio aespoeensis Aspo-2]MBU4242901.1 HAMP domain-containing histidine kinase [Pseudomonadota bacterium]MBU4474103.1 HAMP domain-containing histidine kinase [Pseudomonadota bacterium]MBU4517497.1 HAMP domain-containing histidine kinase [Pseudomonadota bacterium]
MRTPDGPQAEREKPKSGLDFDSVEDRFDYVVKRIEEKLDDYDGYDFSLRQTRALNIFFELAQEVRGRDMFYAVCMMIPRVLFRLESSIYLLEDEETFSLADSSTDRGRLESVRTWDRELTDRVVLSGDHLHIPIQCNPQYADLLPFKPPHNILGSFVMHPCSAVQGHEHLFLEKYVNRVGYQLHQRIIGSRNREHLRFIKSMVQDIGHNVIVPNMYFKLYFNRLKRQIEDLHLVTGRVLTRMAESGDPESVSEGNRLAQTAASIEAQYQEIYRHYETTSMFLETLLRRRHFEEGRYVLEKREVDLRTSVLEPQLERYRQALEERGIRIGYQLGGAPDQEVRMVMDRGLIAQVFANFLSNAVKYTEETVLPGGEAGKFLSYGWQVLKDYFGPALPGIRLWVTTSGPPLRLKDPMTVFKPGFRADNVALESGTGRGLYFARQVIELHGGSVGYRHDGRGNEFYCTLPFEQEPRPPRTLSEPGGQPKGSEADAPAP